MSDVLGRVEDLIGSLGELNPVGDVLAEAARAAALEIDDPPTNSKGQRASVSAPLNALRATIEELVAKGRVDVDDDGDAGDDWADIAAIAGATPIRDAAEAGAGDVGRRGGGGRKAAG